jgi:hypothetical protein
MFAITTAPATTRVAPPRSGSSSSRQKVVDGDLADDHAVNHDRDVPT